MLQALTQYPVINGFLPIFLNPIIGKGTFNFLKDLKLEALNRKYAQSGYGLKDNHRIRYKVGLNSPIQPLVLDMSNVVNVICELNHPTGTFSVKHLKVCDTNSSLSVFDDILPEMIKAVEHTEFKYISFPIIANLNKKELNIKLAIKLAYLDFELDTNDLDEMNKVFVEAGIDYTIQSIKEVVSSRELLEIWVDNFFSCTFIYTKEGGAGAMVKAKNQFAVEASNAANSVSNLFLSSLRSRFFNLFMYSRSLTLR